MTMLKRSLSYLRQSGVRYAHSIHPPAERARDVASAERMPAHNLAKTIVYQGDNGFGMAMLPADCVANLKEIQRLLGLTDIRLATESELAELFPECETGAMPPFGNLFDL